MKKQKEKIEDTKDKILRAKESFYPFYGKGDEFIIVKSNTSPNLMPIEAMRLRDKQIYGFDEGELEKTNKIYNKSGINKFKKKD